jgi:energy-coupling factor transporter ATP-binding protein EcfA2
MVFQNYALFPHMSVERNIGFGLRMRDLPSAEIAPRVERALQLVQLVGQAHKLPGQLSGGQQQRVAIARAIVVEPPLILMDEPLSNLDAKLRIETRAEIRRIHRELDRATIYVTHDQDEALSLADRIVVMKDGAVQQIGTPPEVYGQPANLAVARFMGYRNVLALDVAGLDGDRVSVAGPDVALTGLRMQPLAGTAPRSRSGPRRSSCRAGRREHDRRPRRQRRVLRARRAARRRHRVGDAAARARAGDDPARRRGPRARAARARAGLPGRVTVAASADTLARARFDRALLLVVPAAAFMLILFVYPFLYGLWLSFEPKEGGWLELPPLLHDRQPLPDDLDHAQARAAGDADQRRARAADRLRDAPQVALPAHRDDDPRHPDHARHRADRRGHAAVLRPEGLAVALPAARAAVRRADPPHAQLLGRADLARDLGLPVRVPADPVVHDRHRPGARARRRDARRRPARAVPPHLPAAARAGLAMCFCLAFVQAFSVFPSAVLLGSPAGPRASSRSPRTRPRSSSTTTRSRPRSR